MDVDKRRKGRDEDEDGAGSSDEEGIDLMNSEGDSSEEDSDEDPEEEARIREGENEIVLQWDYACLTLMLILRRCRFAFLQASSPTKMKERAASVNGARKRRESTGSVSSIQSVSWLTATLNSNLLHFARRIRSAL